MKNEFRYPLTVVAMIFVCGMLRSQITVGWNAGYAPFREVNREIYVYNAINRQGLTKEMPEIHLMQGPVLGYRKSGNSGYIEMMFSRKVGVASSEFDSANVPMRRQLKVMTNTFNWGGGYSANGWGAGLSFDFGFSRAKGKRGSKDGFRDLEPVWICTPDRFLRIVNRMLPDATTIWVERDLGNFMCIRLYAEIFWSPTGLASEKSGSNIEYWFFGGSLNWGTTAADRFNSYGAVFYFKFGK